MLILAKLAKKIGSVLRENSFKEISPGRFVSKMDNNAKMAPAKSKIAFKAILHPLKAFEGSLFDVDLWETWRKVRCPVLIIHGKKL